jgi:farnesyl diphosphate synthase
VSALGVPESRQLAEELRQDGLKALEPFGERAVRLRQLADFIVLREF